MLTERLRQDVMLRLCVWAGYFLTNRFFKAFFRGMYVFFRFVLLNVTFKPGSCHTWKGDGIEGWLTRRMVNEHVAFTPSNRIYLRGSSEMRNILCSNWTECVPHRKVVFRKAPFTVSLVGASARPHWTWRPRLLSQVVLCLSLLCFSVQWMTSSLWNRLKDPFERQSDNGKCSCDEPFATVLLSFSCSSCTQGGGLKRCSFK